MSHKGIMPRPSSSSILRHTSRTLFRRYLPCLAFVIASGSLLAQLPVEEMILPAIPLSETDSAQLRQDFKVGSEHAFKLIAAHKDHLGQTHTRVQQYFHGIKIWGGDAVVHRDEYGRMLSISGNTVDSIQLPTQPTLNPKEVLRLVNTDLAPKGPYASEPEVNLVVFPITIEEIMPDRKNIPVGKRSATDYQRRAEKHILGYHVHTELENSQEFRHTDYIVDAHTGAIIKKWDSLETSAAVGTGKSEYSGTVSLNTNYNNGVYELSDITGNMPFKTYNLWCSIFSGSLYSDADNIWGDGANFHPVQPYTSDQGETENGETAAVDAHFGVQSTSEFYRNVFNRKGIDGKNTATSIYVHDWNTDNAYWNSSAFCMHFGTGSKFTSVTSPDVVAHEMSHGLCYTTANLDYSGESGGLNEANSDILGTLAVYYLYGAQGVGNTIPSSIPTANLHAYKPWTLGSQISSTPIRYMYKPSLDGKSADVWSENLKNLDVHYSSGPMNRVAYFMSQGATESGDTSTSYLPMGMKGIGNDKFAHIWYRAMTMYLTSSSNYVDARNSVIQAARDLYGVGGIEEQAAWNAFHGINVGPAWPTINFPSSVLKNQTTYATVLAQPGYSYKWTITGGSLVAQTLDDPIQDIGIFTPGTGTNVTVKCVLTDSNGVVQASPSASIPVGSVPITTPPLVLANKTYYVSTPNTSGYNYKWTITGGTCVAQAGYICVFTAGTGQNLTVKCVVSDSAGVQKAIGTATINILPN